MTQAVEPAPAARPAAPPRRPHPWAELRAAVGLLTRVPVRAGDRSGAAAFPLVGAAIGVVAMSPIVLLGGQSPVLASLLALAATAVVTGAMHLDAVADTADALMARDADAAERARRDPRLGTGGVLALLFVVAIEAAALVELLGHVGQVAGWLTVIAACAASRAAPVLVAFVAADRATAEGSGAWFAGQVGGRTGAIAVVLVAIAAALTGLAGGGASALIAPVGAALSVGLGLVVVRARGRLDGDGLGASTELAFAAALLAAVAVSA
jgi:adenosylcobinamide-GDP ribazoletransferase